MIANNNPHLPPALAAFLADTTATPEQVVAYLQPDPGPKDYRKRKVLRELFPLMGSSVHVARDWLVVEGRTGVAPVRGDTPDLLGRRWTTQIELLGFGGTQRVRMNQSPEGWAGAVFGVVLDALVLARTDESIKRTPSAEDSWRRIYLDYQKGGYPHPVRGDDLFLAEFCMDALSWKSVCHPRIFQHGAVKAAAYQVRALIALNEWLSTTPFGAP